MKLVEICDHDTVNADILEGDHEESCVQWCKRCGSYRRGWITLLGEMVYGEWREPDGIKTEWSTSSDWKH